jgi:uncharacterized damage-inducible protein DinB
MGAGDGVREPVGVWVGVASVERAVGEGIGDVAAFGWVVHAVRTRTRKSNARMASSVSQHGGSNIRLVRANSYDRGMSGGLTPMYGMWRQYNARLVDKIRSLSDEQLKFRARPNYWPIWAIAAHTAGARIYWLCGVFKESGAETTPFTDPLSGYGWEDDENTPRSSNEVVTALESSWKIVDRCLEQWTPSMLSDEFTREIGGKTQIHTRQSVLMRLITHEAYHNGEISLVLGMHGLPEIEVWRSSPT